MKTLQKIHDFTITKDKNNTIYSLVTQLDKICTQACSELQEEFNTKKIV
jgi:hypothetical protein